MLQLSIYYYSWSWFCISEPSSEILFKTQSNEMGLNGTFKIILNTVNTEGWIEIFRFLNILDFSLVSNWFKFRCLLNTISLWSASVYKNGYFHQSN